LPGAEIFEKKNGAVDSTHREHPEKKERKQGIEFGTPQGGQNRVVTRFDTKSERKKSVSDALST